MANRKEATINLTMVGLVFLVTVFVISSSTQAMALGHWNPDGDYSLDSGLEEEGIGSSDTITTNIEKIERMDGTTATKERGGDIKSDDWTSSESVAYMEFQRCLSYAEKEDGFHTQQEVQGCYEPNLDGDNNYISIEDEEYGRADENGMKEGDFTEDTQDKE